MDLDSMDKEGLRNVVDFMLRQLMVMDSFWYLFLEDEYKSRIANKFNERVWQKVGQISARDIMQRFGIREKGLDGFIKALEYFPWTTIVGYRFDLKPGELIISVPECPSQMARLKRDLGEYDCKEMHRGAFSSFAHEVDPAIVVECLHAPPDPHPPQRFCRWRFTVH